MGKNIERNIELKGEVKGLRGWLALSPVIVFLVLYVVVSVCIGDFYKMPISVALMAASIWAVVICPGRGLSPRIGIYSRAAGHADILYMLWVFVLAGGFAAVAKDIGAVDATVHFILSVFPADYIIPVLFIASCFISFSIGTSVGTVVALAPLALSIASATGSSVPFYIATVLGGAFFGDNLSFISDTTIAATRSQGCDMSDKFKANLWIALPAALATLVVYVIMASEGGGEMVLASLPEVNGWFMVPYLVVIVLAVLGVNVMIVMTCGIISALVFGCIFGHELISMATSMGGGIAGMGELIIITLLAAGMLGVIKAAGGISFLLEGLTRRVHGPRGAQMIVVLLVGMVNLCTANNTVAIITSGGIAKDIARRFGLDSRKVASLLDSAACVVQGLIPYGAQTLLATSLAGISPAAPFPYLYYLWALAAMILLSIIFRFPRRLNHGRREGV